MATETELVYLHDGTATTLQTEIVAIKQIADLEPGNHGLFSNVDAPKDVDDKQRYVLVTQSTIFHPQGGGQPSDTGTIKRDNESEFVVLAARMSTIHAKQVLHYGYFSNKHSAIFEVDNKVTQAIDVEKRRLYSRYHTAGHVLGAAVRDLLGSSIPDFDELKASHVPGSAACEFHGLIDGGHKADIQTAVDKIIAQPIPIQIVWWTIDDFKKHDYERLIPPGFDSPTEKLRVILMEGLEAYPCGGTHVATTNECGQTTVTKIKRSKGTSRVSYAVAS